MFDIIKQDRGYVIEFVADSPNDIKNLPTHMPQCAPGSTCLCISDSSVWMLGSDRIWHEI